LTKPARIVTGYLDGLMIDCDHSERGCTELVELGCLETHISLCKYRPVTCPNERCETIVNMADLEQHTSEDCEFRQVFCEECDENMSFKKYGKHGCFISKDVHVIKVALFEMQDQVKEISDTQKEMFEAIQSLTTAVSKLSTGKDKSVPTQFTQPQGNVVVVGGQSDRKSVSRSPYDSVLSTIEMYSLANKEWSKLTPMKQKIAAATAHFYNGRVMVTGGLSDMQSIKSIEYVQIHEEATSGRRPVPMNRACKDEFLSLVNQLPFKCFGHKTAILNDQLWLVGGCGIDNKKQCSNAIYMTPISSTARFLLKCQMAKPLSFHGLEIVGYQLLIIGGSTTGSSRDAVDTVLLYNTATNSLRELHPLPFPMLDMATVKHGEDVIIIGGQNKDRKYLNTVFKYNPKKCECEQLPGMKYKRGECAAVISGNKVFVMGGYNKEQGYLSSVECFDLENQVWNELPSMNEAKYKIAAVLVP
jgi:hypothetical protein